MNLNLPNILTLARIALVPIFVVVFYLPFSWSHGATAVLFALAAITDWLDGYLARRLGQMSAFGAFLDPVADKLMVAIALILLVQTSASVFFTVAAAIIVGREIAISALREWMAELGKRTKVAVSVIGKVKTTAQMVAIVLLLYRYPIGTFPTHVVGLICLYLAAVLTLWSMGIYLRAAWPVLTDGKAARTD
ncbi:MAG: CDP-diacylglycerol--glycerol-3-phosphate 3-phosphatidyltransferase [Gammaproteobacteria bacterium]|jgi:CDP-diacylglycerol--glycerol-3-phosphate 3-phosphatidyltransferase